MTFKKSIRSAEEPAAPASPIEALSAVLPVLETAKNQLTEIHFEAAEDETVVNDLIGSVLATILDIEQFIEDKTAVPVEEEDE